MKDIIEFLNQKKAFISTMESATGGYLASCITNISGSSLVFKFGAVTYSNDFKIKLGVSNNIIDEFTVYSLECAKAMSQAISNYTNSDYGVGITGKLNDPDPNNEFGDNETVYLSIYDKKNNCFYTEVIKIKNQERSLNKELIKDEFIKLFKEKIMY